ncbi:hypothetical protein U9R90_16755 [Streptomyces sp. E11-3]
MHRIFQERPEILTPVFAVLGIELPQKATVAVLTPDVTETKPLERRVDTVMRIGPSDGDDFLLAIESQTARKPDKESSWPYYVAYLQSKYRLPVLLLVVCQDPSTAKWATGPFDCGTRGWTTQRTSPLVAGPHNLPVITDQRTAAAKPGLAAIAAVAHANSPDSDAILEALGRALQGIDGEAADYFNEFLEVNLGKTPAGDNWRRIMSFVSYYPGQGTVRETAYLEGKSEGKVEGKVEGEAESVLLVLEERDIPVPDAARERILTCTEPDVLNLWLRRAVRAQSIDDVFADDVELGGD